MQDALFRRFAGRADHRSEINDSESISMRVGLVYGCRKRVKLSFRRSKFKCSNMIRVILPFHLRTLAHVGSEVMLEVEGPVTQRSVLDALDARYPMLCGTIRDQVTHERRPFLRF